MPELPKFIKFGHKLINRDLVAVIRPRDAASPNRGAILEMTGTDNVVIDGFSPLQVAQALDAGRE